jgi:hypothetical protein
MNKGIVLFAHNSREVDYSLLALISGGLAKRHLQAPVSIITDQVTIDWMKESKIYDKAESIFDKIILVDRPTNSNSRILNDGNNQKLIPFINYNRSSIFELSPYDRTLMLDSDYLIFSNSISHFWETEDPFLISETMKDARGIEIGFLDKFISETGPHMFWATAVMFTKCPESKIFFDLVDHVKEHYRYYASVYRFNDKIYRNDIAFSIAKHICDNFLTETKNSLPPILTISDKDRLEKVKDDGNLIFTTVDPGSPDNFFALSIKNQDVHIMNKQSIIRNADNLLELI